MGRMKGETRQDFRFWHPLIPRRDLLPAGEKGLLATLQYKDESPGPALEKRVAVCRGEVNRGPIAASELEDLAEDARRDQRQRIDAQARFGKTAL